MRSKMTRLTVALTSFTAFVVFLSGGGTVNADPAGCCKQRDVPQGAWHANQLPFSDCQQLNLSKDGDTVFDQQGLVWWDVNC